MKLIKYIGILGATVATLLTSGCVDDMIHIGPDGYPEGETDIYMELDLPSFKVQRTGTRATVFPEGSKGGTVGDAACNTITDLCVLAYDADGNLLSGFPKQITAADNGLQITDENRTDTDASNGTTDQKSTKHAQFTLHSFPYGKYYIYAVANLHKADGTTDTYGVLTQTYSNEIKKRDDFLTIEREYSTTDFRRNCEMLGYFSIGKEEKSPGSSVDTREKYVSIDRTGLTLHTWLRRTNAIVTIDFDGSNLRDNIKLYIKRATIHNVAKKVQLGMRSAVADANGMYPFRDANGRPDGNDQWIEYSSGSSETSWNYISNGHPKLTDGELGAEMDLHGEAANCFYIYENMQGDGDASQQKPQEPDDGGLVKDEKEKFDNKELGSYIEVEGYYDLSSNQKVSRGPIRYRFMLGKDITANFDVERNYHYKITMKPRGNGNDVDWHIEYEKKEGWQVRNPYYVTYLYNHDSTLRFRYTPQEGEEVMSLDAEIVGNNWWPDGLDSYASATRTTQFPVPGIDNNTLMANPNQYKDQFTRNKYTSGELNGRTKYLGNGFLSLRLTDKTNLTYTETKPTDVTDKDFNYTKEKHSYLNDWYFYGKGDAANGVDRSKRSYDFEHSSSGGINREQYYMQKDPVGNGVTFNIPVFTRAKNMVKKSAYTGNNPFVGHTRSAYVKLTVHLKNASGATRTDYEVVRVEQVKRIVNPKAIYRRAGNNENFHVVLKELDSEESTHFSDVLSDGPWMAEVLGDANFININGRQTIKGSSGSAIDFTVRFNKMNRDDRVRNAVIRIRYNNYSCVHLIFVRQGYAPVKIGAGNTLWHTCNMITSTKEADDPRDEGSLFIFGNSSQPLDVKNNIRDYSTTYQFKAPGNFYLADDNGAWSDQNTTTWGNISSNSGGFSDMNVATMQQFEQLYYDTSTSKPNNNIMQAFGVLYADGATETADNVQDAYGYNRHEKDGAKKGMRGIIVYYWDKSNQSDSKNYHNIFFPIGTAGYGHRRNTDDIGGAGTLRYSCGRTGEFPYIANAPLFVDLYKRPGAIYYSKTKSTGIHMADGTYENDDMNSVCIGLDMNYFTFDFNCLRESNVGKGADACFLRCVN